MPAFKRFFSSSIIVVFLALPAFAKSTHLVGYFNYNDLTNELKSISRQYPDYVKMESLGKTIESRDIWLMTLSGDLSYEKPAIVVVGGVEADDVASGELCVRFIKSAAKAYGAVDSLTALFDHFTFYILPRVNPDATEQLWLPISYDRHMNAREMDLDHDGAFNEDVFDDLNGDGWITLMRVADPAGEWILDQHNPQLVRKADPAKKESGAFCLFMEGFDNDGDGQWNEDTVGGVDFNQNFSFNYQPFVPGAGPHPISEIESRAVADFLFGRQNVFAVFSFSQNENLLTPWDSVAEEAIEPDKPLTRVLANDAPYYLFIADQFKKLTGLKQTYKPERGHGNFSEWVYYHYGAWSFSTPAWQPPAGVSENDSAKTKSEDDPIDKERRLFDWLDRSNMDAFVEWTAISHPDFPDQKVEVGGFVPGVQKNPPADSLKRLSEKYNAFLYQLASLAPKLEIYSRVEALDNDVYRILATIKNIGYLPTNSQLGAKSQWLQKVKVELVLSSDQTLVSGQHYYLFDAIAGGCAQQQSWLVTAKKKSQVTVLVGSPSVGYVTKKIVLE